MRRLLPPTPAWTAPAVLLAAGALLAAVSLAPPTASTTAAAPLLAPPDALAYAEVAAGRPDGRPAGDCPAAVADVVAGRMPVSPPLSSAGPGGTEAVRAPGAVVVEPDTDPCLHCHISGEAKAPTTPPARWAIALLAGLAFAVGMVRSATVWRTRSPWKPFAARAVEWVDRRYDVVKPVGEALSKPVPRFARQWAYCLGGMTAFVFVVQAVTGIMLSFYYQPTAAGAMASIRHIEEAVRYGTEVRAIHAWSANAMIILCVAHMIRTYIAGAYKAPRELNWVTGVALLAVTMAFGFTGYLLPWDQRAFWATTVGSDIAGSIPVIGNLALVLLRVGWSVSEATLGRFYALHVIILPVATLATMGAHFLMVRRLGIHRPL